jgi:hypothetical protein
MRSMFNKEVRLSLDSVSRNIRTKPITSWRIMVMVSAPIVAAIVGKNQTIGPQFHSCHPNKFMDCFLTIN